MNVIEIKSLTLAYLGDAYYELLVREYLIRKGIVKPNVLQKEAVKFVSAKGQASFLLNLINKDFFTKKELEIIMRGRNAKSRPPKNTDVQTYNYATAFEALIGYLYLDNNKERIHQIFDEILSMQGVIG